MDLGLKDAVAVVAASSQGIGRATAEGFAREGARVVLNGRDEARLQETARQIAAGGADVYPIAADLTTAEGCERLIAGAYEHFGRIDALVTNAGGPPSKPFEELSDEDWHGAVDLTLMSAVRLMRAALPHLEESKGSVVSVTSISVKQPISGLILSNSIRPGVVGLAKTLALDLATAGVRFNVVGPGLIWTGRQEYLTGVRARNQGISVEEAVRQTEAGIPLGRYGTPEEVANLIVFLCSKAAAYITGTTVMVDGGMDRSLL